MNIFQKTCFVWVMLLGMFHINHIQGAEALVDAATDAGKVLADAGLEDVGAEAKAALLESVTKALQGADAAVEGLDADAAATMRQSMMKSLTEQLAGLGADATAGDVAKATENIDSLNDLLSKATTPEDKIAVLQEAGMISPAQADTFKAAIGQSEALVPAADDAATQAGDDAAKDTPKAQEEKSIKAKMKEYGKEALKFLGVQGAMIGLMTVPQILQQMAEQRRTIEAQMQTVASAFTFGGCTFQLLGSCINLYQPLGSYPLYVLIPAESPSGSTSFFGILDNPVSSHHGSSSNYTSDVLRFEVPQAYITTYRSLWTTGPMSYSSTLGSVLVTDPSFTGTLVGLNNGAQLNSLGDLSPALPLIDSTFNQAGSSPFGGGNSGPSSIANSLAAMWSRFSASNLSQSYTSLSGTSGLGGLGSVATQIGGLLEVSNASPSELPLSTKDAQSVIAPGLNLMASGAALMQTAASATASTQTTAAKSIFGELVPIFGWGSYYIPSTLGTLAAPPTNPNNPIYSASSKTITTFADPINYNALGVNIYLSTKTPFLQKMKQAGCFSPIVDNGSEHYDMRSVYTDWVVLLDKTGAIVPLYVVASTSVEDASNTITIPELVVNPNIMYVASLLEYSLYKDGLLDDLYIYLVDADTYVNYIDKGAESVIDSVIQNLQSFTAEPNLYNQYMLQMQTLKNVLQVLPFTFTYGTQTVRLRESNTYTLQNAKGENIVSIYTSPDLGCYNATSANMNSTSQDVFVVTQNGNVSNLLNMGTPSATNVIEIISLCTSASYAVSVTSDNEYQLTLKAPATVGTGIWDTLKGRITKLVSATSISNLSSFITQQLGKTPTSKSSVALNPIITGGQTTSASSLLLVGIPEGLTLPSKIGNLAIYANDLQKKNYVYMPYTSLDTKSTTTYIPNSYYIIADTNGNVDISISAQDARYLYNVVNNKCYDLTSGLIMDPSQIPSNLQSYSFSPNTSALYYPGFQNALAAYNKENLNNQNVEALLTIGESLNTLQMSQNNLNSTIQKFAQSTVMLPAPYTKISEPASIDPTAVTTGSVVYVNNSASSGQYAVKLDTSKAQTASNNGTVYILFGVQVATSYKVANGQPSLVYTQGGAIVTVDSQNNIKVQQVCSGSMYVGLCDTYGISADGNSINIPARPRLLLTQDDITAIQSGGKSGFVTLIPSTSSNFPGFNTATLNSALAANNTAGSTYVLYYSTIMQSYYLYNTQSKEWLCVLTGARYDQNGLPIAQVVSLTDKVQKSTKDPFMQAFNSVKNNNKGFSFKFLSGDYYAGLQYVPTIKAGVAAQPTSPYGAMMYVLFESSGAPIAALMNDTFYTVTSSSGSSYTLTSLAKDTVTLNLSTVDLGSVGGSVGRFVADSSVPVITLTDNAITYLYSYDYSEASYASDEQLALSMLNNPTVTICPVFNNGANTFLIPDLPLDDSTFDLVVNPVTSLANIPYGVTTDTSHLFTSTDNRYLVSMNTTPASSNDPYYLSYLISAGAYGDDAGYIDLQTGAAFDSSGMAMGVAAELSDFMNILNALELVVVTNPQTGVVTLEYRKVNTPTTQAGTTGS